MGIIIATLIVLVVIASVLAQDYSFFSWDYWQEGGSASRSEVVRNLGLLAAGMIGLGFGIWRAWTAYRQTQASQRQAEAANEQARAANEQARIAQQGHITDRFSTAVEHLGSEQLPVRLGGIYALWRLIEDSPKRDVTSVIDILCAFVRDPPHPNVVRLEPDTSEGGTAPEDEANAANKLRPDVQAIMNLIGNEKAGYRALLPANYRLDFTGANLTNAHLTGANLTNARLTDANLTGIYLGRANLTGAELWGTNLTDAYLSDANLTNADLMVANLTGTDLSDANLTNADLPYAKLTDVKNLTQQQLNAIRCDPDHPPELPQGLVLPEPPAVPEAKSAAPPPPEVL